MEIGFLRVAKQLQDVIEGAVAQALQRHLPGHFAKAPEPPAEAAPRERMATIFKERSFAALLETISR